MTPKKIEAAEEVVDPDVAEVVEGSDQSGRLIGESAPAAIINENLSSGGPHLVDDDGKLTKEGASAASRLP